MSRAAICVLALGCAAIWLPPAGAQGNGGFQYYGITHTSWSANEYSSAAATASRSDLAATNFNWAGVLATWYQPNITTTVITRNASTPTDAAVTQAIQEFHAKGIKVMMKPHVDVSDAAGTWRGNINPTDPNAWFASYTSFILQYAQMAESLGVEMLCIGTELKTVSGAANQARWYGVIDAIRGVYHGALTYAANATSAGDEFTSVSFWDRLDVIGLDGYFALTNKSDPTLAELVAAWRGNSSRLDLVATITNFYNAHQQKPILFTEIGYKSSAGANTEPWNYSHLGAYDPTEQRNCIDAAFTVWSPWSSWMKGFFWWAWPVPVPSATDTDYNPRGKPAADLLRTWQSAPDPHNAVTNAASYRTDAVAPGAIVSLFGASLSAGTSQASAAPLPTVLGDTSVTFNGIPAPLYFASPQQVNAQVPFEVVTGSAIAEVVSKSGIALTQLTMGAAGPGIFTLDGSGTGDGAVIDAVAYTVVTSSHPIAAGGYLGIYCTGLGAVKPSTTTGAVPANPPPQTVVNPSVLIDGQAASLLWSGLAPGFVGLYQVNAQVPATLTTGSHRLQLVVSGAASNTVTFAVR